MNDNTNGTAGNSASSIAMITGHHEPGWGRAKKDGPFIDHGTGSPGGRFEDRRTGHRFHRFEKHGGGFVL